MRKKSVIVKLHKVPLASEIEEKKEIKKKKIKNILLSIIIFLLGFATCFVYFILDDNSSLLKFNLNKFDKIISYFDSTWLYKNDYPDLENELEDKAFYGMTNFIDDPYTTYMSRKEINEFTSSINMNYVGIGAQYSFLGGVGTVTRVFKGSPAEKGGMLAGDIFYKIEGQSLDDVDSDGIKELVVGKEGTTVHITVLRFGQEVELDINRASIENTAYGEKKDGYYYLNIMSFGEKTVDECINYLDDGKDYENIIIDLRDNSGGYQDSVQQIAGLFLGKDIVVLNETDNNGITKSFNTIVKKYYDNYNKIVILINNNTASAAEVLAICLKEMHKNCILVGETTYGKGVVQSSYYLDDGSAIKITSSYWTSPKGVSINNVGVKPDYEVELDKIMYSVAYEMNDDEKYEYDSVSQYVMLAELGLDFLGYDLSRTDGYFDESFKNALINFKKDNNMGEEVILDKKVYGSIMSGVIREYSVNKDKDKQLLKAIEIISN